MFETIWLVWRHISVAWGTMSIEDNLIVDGLTILVVMAGLTILWVHGDFELEKGD